jgi:PAS domain S-box-containing protein
MPWFHGRSNRYGRSSHARPLAIERTHRRTFGSLEFAAQLATLVFALWLVFGSRLSESYNLSHLIFLPVIWVAVRQSIPGVTTAILLLNLGSMVMLNFYPEDLYHLAMLQFLTLIVSLTGLTLGTLITERRSIEDGLRKSEDRLKAIVDAIDEVIFEIDREGIFRNVWTTDDSVLARPREQLIGHRISELLGEVLAVQFAECFIRVTAAGRGESIEYSIAFGADTRWFLARVSPIHSPDGLFRTVWICCKVWNPAPTITSPSPSTRRKSAPACTSANASSTYRTSSSPPAKSCYSAPPTTISPESAIAA